MYAYMHTYLLISQPCGLLTPALFCSHGGLFSPHPGCYWQGQALSLPCLCGTGTWVFFLHLPPFPVALPQHAGQCGCPNYTLKCCLLLRPSLGVVLVSQALSSLSQGMVVCTTPTSCRSSLRHLSSLPQRQLRPSMFSRELLDMRAPPGPYLMQMFARCSVFSSEDFAQRLLSQSSLPASPCAPERRVLPWKFHRGNGICVRAFPPLW